MMSLHETHAAEFWTHLRLHYAIYHEIAQIYTQFAKEYCTHHQSFSTQLADHVSANIGLG